jgi:hypothetical protein
MTTMVVLVPFATHTAWDLWIRPIVLADPLPKGPGGGGGRSEYNKSLNYLSYKTTTSLLSYLR